MTTFPSVGGVGAFIIASAKPVVLEVIHKLKQVNRHGGLTEVGNEVGQASVGKTPRNSARPSGSAGVKVEHGRLPGPAAESFAARGSRRYGPKVRKWGHVSSPVSVMRMVVLGGEVQIEDGKERESGRPPALRPRSPMTKFVGGYDARGPVGQARRGDRKPGEQGQPVEGNSPQQGPEHDRHEHRMKVDDDIMCPSFLKRFGVGRLPEHHFEQGYTPKNTRSGAAIHHPPSPRQTSVNSGVINPQRWGTHDQRSLIKSDYTPGTCKGWLQFMPSQLRTRAARLRRAKIPFRVTCAFIVSST